MEGLPVIREELVSTESQNRFRYADFPLPIWPSSSKAASLDNFQLADGTKAEASRHIDAARLRDRALQPASGALRRYSSIVGPNDD
jgi:hypothetical protein